MLEILKFLGINLIWTWLKPTLEDDNGKASSKKLTAYLVSMLFTIGNIRVFYTMKDDNMVLFTLIIDATFILILFGIIAIKDIITLYRITANSGVIGNNSGNNNSGNNNSSGNSNSSGGVNIDINF